MSVLTTIARSRTVAALASPHGVDHYLSRVNPMWAAHEVRGRVVAVHRETETPGAPVATLTIQPTATWRGHRAGQYVQVGVELPGSARRMTRCFSISSAASLPGERITLTIRANDEGQVSSFLVNEAKVGQMLHLSQAEGDFTLPFTPTTGGPDRVVMISGGSGITTPTAFAYSSQASSSAALRAGSLAERSCTSPGSAATLKNRHLPSATSVIFQSPRRIDREPNSSEPTGLSAG